MPKTSSGLIMYRVRAAKLQILLVHPGGPFYRNRDEGAWTIPKGELGGGEDPLSAARREFEEETGLRPVGPFIELTPVRQKGGKIVYAWAFSGDCNPSEIRSNTFALEWPPHSGQTREFPEIDRAEFFGVSDAGRKINTSQLPLVEELEMKWRVDRLIRNR